MHCAFGRQCTRESVQVGPSCQLSDDEFMPLPIKGFSGIEVGPIRHVWAIDRFAELSIPDAAPKQRHEILCFDLTTLNARVIKISTSDGEQRTIKLVPG
jgi:hypothetical protein